MASPTVWSVFSETVARFGERTAVEIQRPDRVDAFTYQQLHDLAVAHASWLVASGVQQGDRCAILAHNDAHWCAAQLAILRAGATAVPLDTNYSAKQVATIVRDSGARVLYVSAKFAAVAAEALKDDPAIVIVDLHVAPEHLSTSAPQHVSTSAPAVILYTSGTTSDPKGVVLTHANLLAEREAAFAVVDVTEQDAVLGVLPLFHSLAQMANLLLPFAVGARVVYLETLNSTDLVQARWPSAGSRSSLRAAVLLPDPPARHAAGAEGRAWLTRLSSRDCSARTSGCARLGINIGPIVFGKVHDVMGGQMRLLVTGGSKFDPAIGRDLYCAGLHHPAGLRPHRDQCRRRHHQHARRSAHRHGGPRAAGQRAEDPAAGGDDRRRRDRDSRADRDAGVLQPARGHRRGDARRLVLDRRPGPPRRRKGG